MTGLSEPKPAATTGFPGASSLCEGCGYPLRGLIDSNVCPECGMPIAESDPIQRSGLPWQNSKSIKAWVQTSWEIVARPGTAFRKMAIDGAGDPGASNRRDRRYMALFVGVAVVLTMSVCSWIWRKHPGHSLPLGLMMAGTMVVLTYIEAAGVTFFSRLERRPIRWATAERVACYSVIGWLPAIVGWAGFVAYWLQGSFSVPSANVASKTTVIVRLVIGVLLGITGMMWFELLVWLGIRKVRHANSLRGDGPLDADSTS